MEHIVKNDEQFAPNCKCGAGRMFQGLFCVIMFFSSSPLEKGGIQGGFILCYPFFLIKPRRFWKRFEVSCYKKP